MRQCRLHRKIRLERFSSRNEMGSQKAGKIEFGAGSITIVPCAILDISTSGASIEVDSAVRFPNSFKLSVDGQNSRHSCQVKWRKGRRLGVAFSR